VKLMLATRIVVATVPGGLTGMEGRFHQRMAGEKPLRSVLITASIAALGLIPLLLSTGVGSEVQRPLFYVSQGKRQRFLVISRQHNTPHLTFSSQYQISYSAIKHETLISPDLLFLSSSSTYLNVLIVVSRASYRWLLLSLILSVIWNRISHSIGSGVCCF